MKKYLLGIIAVVVAIGLSSFTSTTVKESKSKMVDFYWYGVDEFGYAQPGLPIFDEELHTQVYAEENNDCTPGTDADCMRGFSEKLVDPTQDDGQAIPIEKDL